MPRNSSVIMGTDSIDVNTSLVDVNIDSDSVIGVAPGGFSFNGMTIAANGAAYSPVSFTSPAQTQIHQTLTEAIETNAEAIATNAEAIASIGGGKVLTMPKAVASKPNLNIKSGTTERNMGESLFYVSIEGDHSDLGFEAATWQPTSDTLEQTVIDTGTGFSGVLTQVLSPRITVTASDVTIRVYIDGGDAVEFVQSLPLANNSALAIGGLMPWLGTNSTAVNTGYGSGSDVGYYTSTSKLYFSTPFNTLVDGMLHGMIFKDSLKVTVQSSAAPFQAGSSTHKAVATWLNYIPEGLV